METRKKIRALDGKKGFIANAKVPRRSASVLIIELTENAFFEYILLSFSSTPTLGVTDLGTVSVNNK